MVEFQVHTGCLLPRPVQTHARGYQPWNPLDGWSTRYEHDRCVFQHPFTRRWNEMEVHWTNTWQIQLSYSRYHRQLCWNSQYDLQRSQPCLAFFSSTMVERLFEQDWVARCYGEENQVSFTLLSRHIFNSVQIEIFLEYVR